MKLSVLTWSYFTHNFVSKMSKRVEMATLPQTPSPLSLLMHSGELCIYQEVNINLDLKDLTFNIH